MRLFAKDHHGEQQMAAGSACGAGAARGGQPSCINAHGLPFGYYGRARLCALGDSRLASFKIPFGAPDEPFRRKCLKRGVIVSSEHC